jgi:hypothetical protein
MCFAFSSDCLFKFRDYTKMLYAVFFSLYWLQNPLLSDEDKASKCERKKRKNYKEKKNKFSMMPIYRPSLVAA